jgi:hypothetical protein
MYVRLVSFSGGSAEMRDSWVQTIQDTALPAMREQNGFAGYIGLMGKADHQVKGLLFFDTEENAEAAEQAMQERRREVTGSVGLTVESADLYDVLAMEMEAARG